MGTAGIGYINANANACGGGYTYIDPFYPATEDMMVSEIQISNADAGTNFKIGCGTLDGTAFLVRHYVTLASMPVGQLVFKAPVDFTAFQMYEGECIALYSTSADGRPTRTSSANPDGCRYASGDRMDSGIFGTTAYTSTMEIKFLSSVGWAGAEVDGQDPSNIDTVEDQELSNIDTIDGQ